MAQHPAEAEHESFDGITEDPNFVPTALVASMIVVVLAGYFFTFPLWGERPASDPMMPVTVWYNHIDARPWWDLGYTMIGVEILMWTGWVGFLIKTGKM